MRELTANEVEFVLECFPEDMQIEGNASAIDPVEDAKTYKWIRAQLNSGNEWAWCQVKVTAKWNGFEGTDYLGGCSYTDENDFRTPGGYFDDMKQAALDDLNSNIAAVQSRLSVLVGK